MKRLSLILIWCITLVLIAAVVSCGTSTTTAPTKTAPAATTQPTVSKYGGTLKVILRANVTILGTPSEGPGGSPHRSVESAYDMLVRYDENFNVKQRLAESWDIAPDGKTITFRLRKGIKFHDGTPFNAAAVKYNLQNYAPSGVVPPSMTKVTSVDVIDDYTVRLNLKAYDATIFLDLGDSLGFMCSPTAMQKATTDDNRAIDHLVGTGPFKLVEFKRLQYAKYVKYPDYWQPGKPYLDAWEAYFIPDPVTSLMSLQKGEAQVIHGLTPTEANQVKSSGGFDILTTQVRLMSVLIPDGANKDSPWADKRVRQAAEYAIDKNALAQSIGEGYYKASYQFAPEGAAHFVSGLQNRTYNETKAKQLLAEAGYPNGFQTKIYAATTYNKDILVGIQTYLKKVGIDAQLDLADPARMTDMQNNGWRNGLYMPSVPIISNLRSLSFRLAATGYVSRPTTPDWEAKADATVAQPDPKKNMEQFRELVKIMADEVLNISLWEQPDISAVNKSVQDLKWSQSGHPRFYEPQDAWLIK